LFLKCPIYGEFTLYEEMWVAAAGEVLECMRVPHNVQGRYTVTVKKMGTIMRHLPRRLSRVCSLFLRWGGTISCTVTGRRRYSIDLYIALNLLSCTQKRTLFSYRKLLSFQLLSINFW